MSAEVIGAVGVNHKTAPVEIREKMAFSGDCRTALLAIRDIPGCGECCFLSTCNRVEVLFTGKEVEAAAAGVRRFLFANTGLSDEDAQQYSYSHQGPEAVRHMFRVASSLDSMIVGEPQILGQLKDAYREAAEAKTTGVILNKMLHKAFSVAKRIRTETNIGSSAVSISYAAVELAKKIFGDLQGKKVLLIGAGEMAELAAQHLVSQGIANVIVANRTFERAAKLARTFNGKAVGLDELVSQLEEVDIIISSTGAPGLVLKAEDVRPVMRQRMNSPLFLIDIAVPRDLDPALNDLDNVYLYDIDDLKTVVEGNKAEREKEAMRAERIVEEEALKFTQWLEGMGVSPTIVALRRKAEEIRLAEFSRTQSQLNGLDEKELKKVDAMTGAIINKLLHHPMVFLKTNSSSEDIQQKLDLVRQIFGLDEEEQV